MSWFGNNKTLCEELYSTSNKTADSREKAVDGLYPTVRDAVLTELRTHAKQNKVKKTTVSIENIFTEEHSSALLSYFRKAVGKINPANPTVKETDAYGEKVAQALTEQGIVASYENNIITANWEVVPIVEEILDEEAVVEAVPEPETTE